MKELCLVQKLDQEDEGTSSEISHLQSQLQKASADTSANNWNFTNAAILLQNSSSVYSRKVEYLHSLVYQTLHRLSDNSATNGNGKDKHKKKHDVDIQEFEAFDPNSYFLVFEEDTLPIDLDGKSIDLHQDAAASSHHHGINIQDMEHAQNSHATPLNINLNMNTNMNQTRLSLDRTAIESITKNKSTIRSHAGQQLIRSILEGSQGRNANMGGNGGGGMHGMRGAEGQAVLRLMNGVCDVSDSGALLLPGTGIGIHTRNIGGDNGDGSTQERLDMDVEDYRHGYGVHHNDGAPAAAGEGGPVQFDQGQGYDDDNDDDNNDGAGFELHSPYPRPSMHPDEMIATNAHGTTAGNGANAIAIANTIHQKKDSTTSPWDLLDPHDASESKSRPLRKAITFCLPHGVQLPPSALVTGARTKKIPRARVKNNQHDEDDYEHSLGDGAGSSLAVREHRAALQKMEASSHDDDDMDMDMDTSISNKKQKMVPLPIQPLAFGDEFLYVLQSQQRQRAAEKRRIKKIQRLRQQEAIGMHSNSNRGMDANERFDDMYDDNDEDDVDGQAFDFAGGDYDNGDGGDDNDHHHDLGDDDNVFDRVFARDINANGDGTAGQGAECKTFEELCRQHLKEFAKGAERFAVETHLSKRVENWQMKLEVVLAEEEERPEFDIQLYGNRIMASAQDCLQKEKVSEIGGLVSADMTIVSFGSFLVAILDAYIWLTLNM